MSLSPEDIEKVRYTVERILRGMRGAVSVWNLILTSVRPLDSGGYYVEGSFTNDFAGVNKHTFRVKLTKDLKVEEITIE